MWVCLIAVGCAACSAGASEAPARQVVLHVGPGGRDTWSGALPAANRARTDGPLATLAGARDRLRRLRAARKTPVSVRVVLHGGTYRLAEPLTLQPRDSGSPGAPVVFEAAPGASPVVSGGREITEWLEAGGGWVARVPALAGRPWLFRQLFVDGRRRQRARSPNAGFFTVDGPVDNVWRWGPNGAKEDLKPSAFRYRAADIDPRWAARGDVEVVALQVWAESRMRIASVNPAARRVTLSGTCCPSNRETDARYWVENAPECLDAPGEWYLDAQAGEVHYIPLPGEKLGKVSIAAPALRELLRLEGDPATGATVHDVEFRGITFRDADWSLAPEGYVDVQAAFDVPAAVTAIWAERCRFERCTFRSVGAWAVELGRGCHDCSLTRCEMTDTGAGGIRIGEYAQRPEPREQASGNRLERCRVQDIGRVYPAAVGIWIGQAHHNTVTHCEVADTWQSGISVGWSWGYAPSLAHDNLVEACHVHHIGRGLLSDMGGIYTLGVQPGTIIRGNHVHDVRSRQGGGWGIYLDEGSSGIRVEGNIVHRTTSAGFMLHYGRDNVVTDNVFALSDEPNILRFTEDEQQSFVFERNIVLAKGGLPLGGKWANGRFALDRNVYWSAGGYGLAFDGKPFAEWQQRGYDTHSIVADPLFLDAARGDFRLQPTSPALGLGFRQRDWRQAGP